MTRLHVTLLLALGMGALLVLDRAQSRLLNPYTAPPLLALGSGLAASGAH